MIEDLLSVGKISSEQYEAYVLFEMSEMGRKWLKDRTMDVFMEEPAEAACHGEPFAYISGRASLLRNIHAIIEFVNKQLRELENDGSNSL